MGVVSLGVVFGSIHSGSFDWPPPKAKVHDTPWHALGGCRPSQKQKMLALSRDLTFKSLCVCVKYNIIEYIVHIYIYIFVYAHIVTYRCTHADSFYLPVLYRADVLTYLGHRLSSGSTQSYQHIGFRILVLGVLCCGVSLCGLTTCKT